MITKLEIPTGNPIQILLDQELNVTSYKYLDHSRAKKFIVNK